MANNAEVRLRVTSKGVDEASKDLQGLNKSAGETGKAAGDADKKFKIFGKTVGSARMGFAAAGAAAVAAAAGLWKLTDAATAAIDEMNKASIRLGTTTEFLSEMEFAARRSGASVGEFRNSMKFLSRNMIEAREGVGPAAEAFQRLGISVVDASGRTKSMEQVFDEVIAKMDGLDSEADKVAAAMDIFGRSGEALIPMFKEGSAGVEELREEVRRLGGVVSGDMANAASEFQDSMENMKTAAGGLKNTIATALAPAFKFWGEQVTELLAGMNKLAGGQDDLGATLDPHTEDVMAVTTALGEWNNRLVGLREEFDRVSEADFIDSDHMATLNSQWVEAQAMIEKLNGKLVTLTETKEANNAATENAAASNRKLAGSLGEVKTAEELAAEAERERQRAMEEERRIQNSQLDRFAKEGMRAAEQGNVQMVGAYKAAIMDLRSNIAEQMRLIIESGAAVPEAMRNQLVEIDAVLSQIEERLAQERDEFLKSIQGETVADILGTQENAVQTTVDNISGVVGQSSDLIGAVYDLVGDKADANTKKGLKFTTTMLSMIAKLITARLSQAAVGSTAAQIEATSQQSAMNKITAAATPAAATTSIATFGGSAAAGLGLFIGAATAIAGLVGSLLSIGDAGILPGGLGSKLDSAIGRSHSVTIRRNDEAVIDPKGTRELTNMLTMHRRNMQIGASPGGSPQMMAVSLTIPEIEIGREAVIEFVEPVLQDRADSGELSL